RPHGCGRLTAPVRQIHKIDRSGADTVSSLSLTDLPAHLTKLIEDVQVDNRGRLIPRLYSKEKANKELRNMLNLSAKSEAPDVTKLSDSELIAQLGRQAKELGIEIDLNYSFAQPKKTDNEP